MRTYSRLAIWATAAAATVLAAWALLIVSAASAGLYENTEPAGRGELWVAAAALSLGLAATAGAATRRFAASALLALGSLAILGALVLTGTLNTLV